MENQNRLGLFEQTPKQPGQTPEKTDAHRLYQAAQRGDLEAVRGLVERGVNPEADYRRMVMDLIASNASDENYMDFFCQNLGERYGWSPYEKTIEIAIKHRADFLPEKLDGYSVVAALRHGHIETARYLAEQGFAENALALAVQENVGISEKLMSLGAIGADRGSRALHRAAERQNWDMVKALVTRGADVNIALREVADAKDLPMVQYLLDHGAQVEARDLQWMARSGDFSILEFFAEQKSQMPDTILCDVIYSGHHGASETVRFLVERGTPVTLKNLSDACYQYDFTAEGRELICLMMEAVREKELRQHGELSVETAKGLEACRDELKRGITLEKGKWLEKIEGMKKEIATLEKELGSLDAQPPPLRVEERLPGAQKQPARHSIREKLAEARQRCAERQSSAPDKPKARDQEMQR